MVVSELVCKDPEWTHLAQDGPVVGSGKRSNEVLGSTGAGMGSVYVEFLDYRFLFHGNDYVVNYSAAPEGVLGTGGRHPRLLDHGAR